MGWDVGGGKWCQAIYGEAPDSLLLQDLQQLFIQNIYENSTVPITPTPPINTPCEVLAEYFFLRERYDTLGLPYAILYRQNDNQRLYDYWLFVGAGSIGILTTKLLVPPLRYSNPGSSINQNQLF